MTALWLLVLNWVSLARTHNLDPRRYTNSSSTALATTEFSSCTWLNSSTFSAPAALSSCAVCCNQAAIKEYVFTWTAVPRVPVVVGTVVVVVDKRTNRTSSRTELHTVSVTATGAEYDPSSWFRNGSFYSPSLTAPKTIVFPRKNGTATTYTYPTVVTSIVESQYWIGQLPVSENGTSKCLTNPGSWSALPPPSNFTKSWAAAPDSDDPMGMWWNITIHESFWGEEDIDWHYPGQIVQSIYDQCGHLPLALPETVVNVASFLLETSTSFGDVAALTSSAAPAAMPIPAASRTAPPVTAGPLSGSQNAQTRQSKSPSLGHAENTGAVSVSKPAAEDNGHSATAVPNIGGIIASIIGMSKSESQAAPQPDQASIAAPSSVAAAAAETSPQQVGTPNGQPDRPNTIPGSTALHTADVSSHYLVGSETLVSGGYAIAQGSTTYSLASDDNAVVINGQTAITRAPMEATLASDPGRPAFPAPRITVDSSIFSADSSSQYHIGSETLVPGGPAITVGASTYSLESSGAALVVNGHTSSIAAPVGTPVGLGPATATSILSGYVLDNGETLFAGGSSVVYQGSTFSLASSGRIVINGVTSTIGSSGGSPSTSPETALVVNGVTTRIFTPGRSITAAGRTITADQNGEFTMGSQVLKPGGEVTASGTAYSLDLSGTALIVDGETSSMPSAPARITVLGSTIIGNSDGDFVIESQTLKPGSAVTINGVTYSLATASAQSSAAGRSTDALASRTASGSVAPSTAAASSLGVSWSLTTILLGAAGVVSGAKWL